ncbi:MAG: glycerophosphodiester phosphodiesterase [Myxococcota bacterium]
MKRAAAVAAVLVVAYCAVALGSWLAATEMADHAYLSDGPATPWVIAHRGGARLWPENTLLAFQNAHEAGVDVLEFDVHLSADGELVVIHDATVDRTTEGSGAVADTTVEALQALDAGYRWESPDGETLFRGKGIRIPTLTEVFERFPVQRLNIEMKSPGSAGPLCGAIETFGAEHRVMVATGNGERMERFRDLCPTVATSATAVEALGFLIMHRTGLTPTVQVHALQVPTAVGALSVITEAFVRAAEDRNIAVHGWTVNAPAEMQRLTELGIDGIMTDDPETLLRVLGRVR